nr:hypothetical protein [Tanacetum cinerariifolium]
MKRHAVITTAVPFPATVSATDRRRSISGIRVREMSDRRLEDEKISGEKWYRRSESDGWPKCAKIRSGGAKMVAEVVLESNEFASWFSLLGLGFEESQSQRNGLTVFAPVDEVMVDYSDRFPDYPSLFLRHVLPCKVPLNELVSIENGSVLSLDTFLNGFRVSVTRSGVTLMVNEVNIVFPDMYYSDWLVIHGVSDVISVLELEEDFDESDGDLSEPISPVVSSRGPDGDL